MNQSEYDSLTPMERNCLRLAHHERKTEQIAHELGIAPSTVNTHIFAARRKLGGISRLSAADRLRRHEAATAPTAIDQSGTSEVSDASGTSHPHSSALPLHPISIPPLSTVGMPTGGADPSTPTEVREERATFVFDVDAPIPGGPHHRTEIPYLRVTMILAMAVLAALVLIAAPAIYDSTAQRIANSLERPHSK